MPVRISEITVRQLGPLDPFEMKPGSINLVYGRNEKGKTTLVEFLVRSLFRNSKDWRLRPAKGVGRVMVDGLGDRPQAFSPANPKKLEDFWENEGRGMPPDFSRILVVKGAEPDLSRVEGGADRAVLKSLLSGADMLDDIQNRISKTIQAARLEGGVPVGPKRGEFEEKARLEELLKKLDVLFDQIDRGYSGGKRRQLSDERASIGEELDRLENAKRHLAFRTHENLHRLEILRESIDTEGLKSLRQKIHHFRQKDMELERKRIDQAEAEKRSDPVEWLRSARERYREIGSTSVSGVRPMFFVLALVSAAAAFVLILLRQTMPAAILLAAAAGLGSVYVLMLRAAAAKALNVEERAGLKREFEKRFGLEFSGPASMEALLHKLEPDYSEARILKRQIADDTFQQDRLEQEINESFAGFGTPVKDSREWDAALQKLDAGLRDLTDRLQEGNVLLAKLGIPPSDYEPKDPGCSFDERQYAEFRKRSDAIDRELEDSARRLDNLKDLICRQTDDAITASWETVIENLKARREAVSGQLRDRVAEILGKVALLEVIEFARKGEDVKIEDALCSPEVCSALEKCTGRYKTFRLDGERLWVSDQYHEFTLSELSTGAQEQALLALRIGFASRILRRDRLFLLLDDAFQYSDWDRRLSLVRTAADLARDGWQIFYFTMDNHLRDLFDQKGKAFGKEYVRVELE